MEPDKITTAIAKIQGWEIRTSAVGTLFWVSPDGEWFDNEPYSLPDYINNLKHIQLAIRSRKSGVERDYIAWTVVQILDKWSTWQFEEYKDINCWEMSLGDISDVMGAPAIVWAEAFLRVLGKWEDDYTCGLCNSHDPAHVCPCR